MRLRLKMKNYENINDHFKTKHKKKKCMTKVKYSSYIKDQNDVLTRKKKLNHVEVKLHSRTENWQN